MSNLRQLVEWYFGLAPAGVGEGTTWELTTRSILGGPIWLVGLLAMALIAGLTAISLQESRGLGLRRIWLWGLRVAGLGLVLLLLTEATLSVNRTGLPYLAVVIDTSASMGLSDRYSDTKVQRFVEAALPTRLGAERSRLELVKTLMSNGDSAWLRKLAETHRLRTYSFAESAAAVAGDEPQHHNTTTAQTVGDDDLTQLVADISKLVPDGPGTRPGVALKQVLEDFRGHPPTAIIVFTDGVASTSQADVLSTSARLARELAVPILPVGVGSAEPTQDLQLMDVVADEFIFLGDPLVASFRVRAFGTTQRPLVAELIRSDTQEVVAVAEATSRGNGAVMPLELTFTPTDEGDQEFEVRLRPWPDEARLDNNLATVNVRVRREKMRVLLAERSPRWEFRHLKSVLERDTAVELLTLLQDSDLEYVQQDRTALPRFPVTSEELNKFDVVILGDLDLSLLNSRSLEYIRDFVRERGGGLLLIAGERHNPLSFQGTPLEGLLPFELASVTSPRPDELRTGFRPVRSAAGQNLPHLRLGDDAQRSDAVWQSLPESYWWLNIDSKHPGAMTTIAHPTHRSPTGPSPLVLWQRLGAGQVVFHATDEFWQWRRGQYESAYDRYFTQLVRSLCRSRIESSGGIADLTTSRRTYSIGEPIEVLLQLRNPPPTADGTQTSEVFAPPAPRVLITGAGSYQQEITLVSDPQTAGHFTGQLPPPPAGGYRVTLIDPVSTESPPVSQFQVEIPNRELQERSLNRTDLIHTATITRGKYYEIHQLDTLATDLPPGRPVPLARGESIPLWNRWEVLVLFCVIVGAEWLLRKRSRLA